jgi:hypothetical protein
VDDSIIAAMERELAALDAKANAIRAVVTLYRNGGVDRVAKAVVQAPRPIHRSQNEGGGIAHTVIAFARDLCRRSEGPVPTRDIMEHLTQQGLEIHAAVPQNVVSSILSRSDEFESNGRSGWTLTTQNPGKMFPNENAPPSSTVFDDALGGADTALHAQERRPQE